MFSYLKYFFLGSLVLIITASSFFTLLYKENVQEILHKQNVHNNYALAAGFENTIFHEFEEVIATFQTPKFTDPNHKDENGISDYQNPKDYQEYKQIFEGMARYFNDMPVIAAGLYNTKQELLYFYPYAEDAKSKAAKEVRAKRRIGLVEAIKYTESQNEIIEDASFLSIDGKIKNGPVLHTVMPIHDKNGQLAGAVEVFTEISDATDKLNELQYIGGLFIVTLFVLLLLGLYWIVRRAEKIIEKQYDVNMELQSAKVAAESENEQKSQFLANISHELRTPLNAIIGFSEIMKDEILGAIGNLQYKNYVTDIHTQGVHLLSLINDILDFSKAEAGKLDLEYEEIDLNKLIKASIRTQEPRAQTAEVGLFDDLPSTHIIMQTDAKRLKQIMLNLLSNAVKFTPPQGRVAVAAWESAIDGKVCIEVSDTGIGIAAKDIAKALAPFGQVDSELSRRYEGTGLGLPLTKKFIELLGGTMNLESEVGKGTRITVILPREKPDAKAQQAQQAQQPQEPMPKGSRPEGTGGRLFSAFQRPKD